MKIVASDETFLVICAQSGDRQAFDELLQRVQSPLWRYILSMVRDPHFAENVLQDVFWIIYRKIGWLTEPSLFRPWMYKIASRECLKQLKKEKRWQTEVQDDENLENVPADAMTDVDTMPSVEMTKLLSELSPGSRAVMTLHYIEEMSLAETAEILGLSIGTVKSRLAYGLATLRNHLKVITPR